jgi:hypothetical protein
MIVVSPVTGRRLIPLPEAPCLDLGRKTKRYVVKDVSAWLDSRREGANR